MNYNISLRPASKGVEWHVYADEGDLIGRGRGRDIADATVSAVHAITAHSGHEVRSSS